MPKLNESCSPHVPRSSCDERLKASIAPTSSNTMTGNARNESTRNAMSPSPAMSWPAMPRRLRSTSRTIATAVASTAHSSSRPLRPRAPEKAVPRVGSSPSIRCAAPDMTAACPMTVTHVARSDADPQQDPPGPLRRAVVAEEERGGRTHDREGDHRRHAHHDGYGDQLAVAGQEPPRRLRQPPPVGNPSHAAESRCYPWVVSRAAAPTAVNGRRRSAGGIPRPRRARSTPPGSWARPACR